MCIRDRCQAGQFRDRDVYWFIGNVAALSAFIRGNFEAIDVDRAAAVVSLAAAWLQTRIWFEYVESGSNWADELSRGGEESTSSQGFALRRVEIPAWPWLVGHEAVPRRLAAEIGAALEVGGEKSSV